MRRLGLAILICLGLGTTAHASGLFGKLEIKTNRIASIPKWVTVLQRMGGEGALMQACASNVTACPNDELRRWSNMLADARTQGSEEQIDRVNRFVNSWPYINDINLYGKSDVWATPKEFFANSGDCEDYAIAKYASLRLLGVPAARLRLVIVHDELRDIAHAVLGVKNVDGEELILDNLSTRPIRAKFISQYKPYYAVNEDSRWVFLDR